jgi:two-component system, NtrC family, response regulator HydG
MGNLSIFIVDDDVDFAESLAEILELEGHTCEMVHDGEAALEKIKEKKFDLTFMDIKLPGKNGVESFMDIKKIRPDAKVIMMTGYSVEELLNQAVENGAWGILYKPLDLDKALSMVKKVSPSGILIADDDPDFVCNLKDILESSGFVVYQAKDGREAIEKMEDTDLDILILDLHMPILSGLETFLLMKERKKAIPTIIVTAYADVENSTLEKLKGYCVNGIINKPFDPESLIKIVNEIMEDPKKVCY